MQARGRWNSKIPNLKPDNNSTKILNPLKNLKLTAIRDSSWKDKPTDLLHPMVLAEWPMFRHHLLPQFFASNSTHIHKNSQNTHDSYRPCSPKVPSPPNPPPPTHATYDHNFISLNKIYQSISYEKQLKHFASSTTGRRLQL